jgi:hypothetical protein
MDIAERVQHMRRANLGGAAIAAILDVEPSVVADVAANPGTVLPVTGGPVQFVSIRYPEQTGIRGVVHPAGEVLANNAEDTFQVLFADEPLTMVQFLRSGFYAVQATCNYWDVSSVVLDVGAGEWRDLFLGANTASNDGALNGGDARYLNISGFMWVDESHLNQQIGVTYQQPGDGTQHQGVMTDLYLSIIRLGDSSA